MQDLAEEVLCSCNSSTQHVAVYCENTIQEYELDDEYDVPFTIIGHRVRKSARVAGTYHYERRTTMGYDNNKWFLRYCLC